MVIVVAVTLFASSVPSAMNRVVYTHSKIQNLPKLSYLVLSGCELVVMGLKIVYLPLFNQCSEGDCPEYPLTKSAEQ